jgi:N-acetylglucosamine-6-phosphate deacetylase
MESTSDALAAVETLLASHGVTSYCPTTVTAPMEKTLAALERLGRSIGDASERTGKTRARPIGIHLEGPFISTAKCGVHPVADITAPTLAFFDQLWNASHGSVRVITIAPELPGAEEVIRKASKRGVCVSLGHSNALAAETQAAIVAGAAHVTHTFNAMRPLDHREPGILGVALSDPRLTADIIADGVHLTPEILRLFLACKKEEGAVLISDGISATGMGDGKFMLGTIEVEVRGMECRAGGKLAGSVLTLDRAVRNVMQFAQWKLERAVRLATLNPACALGIADRKGSLATGKDADIVVLTPRGEVITTIVGGVGV